MGGLLSRVGLSHGYPMPLASLDSQTQQPDMVDPDLGPDLFKSVKSKRKWVVTARNLFLESAAQYKLAIGDVIRSVEEAEQQEAAHEAAVALYCSAVEAGKFEAEAGQSAGAGVEQGLALTDACSADQVSALLREVKDAATGLQDELEALRQARGSLAAALERKVAAELGRRLREAVEAAKRQATEEAKACHICMDRPHNVILLPCVHAHFCTRCVEKLRADKSPCPTCSASITSTLEYKM